MADTERLLSTILALLADNTTGDISEQDIRDTIVSVNPGHGELYVSASAATTLADTTTWVQVAGTYTLSADASGWAQTVSGRLYSTHATTRRARVTITASMTSGSNNQTVEWAVAKNGTVLTPSRITRFIATGANIGAVVTSAIIDVANGSYISAMVRNLTGANNVTATQLNMTILDFID